MKGYTDIEQSKKLAEFLPIESADMHYVRRACDFMGNPVDDKWSVPKYGNPNSEHANYIVQNFTSYEKIPCWSLAALSEFILPYIADDDGNIYKFYLSKDGLDRWFAYYKSDDVSIHICEESDNMIDVILEMVCWLKKEEYV